MANIRAGAPDALNFRKRLQAFCKPVEIASGQVLREKGQHYTKMYIVTDGEVEVDLGIEGGVLRPVIEGLGLPIGEIGFLRGHGANATVSALTSVRAVEIDDDVLSAIEESDGGLAVGLLRFLGQAADERTSYNIELVAKLDDPPPVPSVEILLCRDESMLNDAKRLRYDVYCNELGRQSPHADHDNKTISDKLDAFGHTFIAVEDGKTIGTLRANRASEGDIGILETLYGMDTSEFHPNSTVVCTKFITSSEHRGSAAGVRLVGAFARFGIQNGIRECYMDCVPSLRPFYMGIGFRTCGEKFLHRENGPSIPMKIDLVKHRGRIDRILLARV